jgi:predicted  nucleic acid-binding Zn-ribbon protein
MGNQNDSNPQVLFLTDREQFAQLANEVCILKEQMKQVAVILEQLTQKTAGIGERATTWEAQFAEIKPCLQAMKVHVDSVPHALREARRSDVAAQKAVEELSARLHTVESRTA